MPAEYRNLFGFDETFVRFRYNLEAGDFCRVVFKIWSETRVWTQAIFLAADSSRILMNILIDSIAVVSSAASSTSAKTFRVRHRNYEYRPTCNLRWD